MEFFYLFLTLLVIYYVSDFWRARRSKQPWLLKKLNPLGERTGETVWTDWLESPQRETPLLTPRERKEQHTQHREAEAASKNQRNEEIFRAYESILRESLAATHSLDFNTLYDYVPLPISSVPADLVQAALPPIVESFRQSKIRELLSRFYPGHDQRQIDADEEQSYLYHHAVVSWEQGEQSRIASLLLHKAEFERQLSEAVAHNESVHQKRDRLSHNYLAGDEFVVAAYAKKILEASPYPKWLSRKIKTVYASASKQLIVDFDLHFITDIYIAHGEG